MRTYQDENLLDDNFFRKFQQIDLICKSLTLFDLEHIVHNNDSFKIEYDETVGLHVIIHESTIFDKSRAICYVDQDNFDMQAVHHGMIEYLKYAWSEYLI